MGKPDVGKMKAKKDVEGLIKALTDKDEQVQKQAAKALEKIGGKRANEALAEVAKYPTYAVGISKITRLGAFPSMTDPLPSVNWPQCCCICLESVGPFDFHEIRKKEVFQNVPTYGEYIVEEVKLKIPYCKNCHHKVKKLFGGESEGVSIEVRPAGIILKFRCLLYANMFRKANKNIKP